MRGGGGVARGGGRGALERDELVQSGFREIRRPITLVMFSFVTLSPGGTVIRLSGSVLMRARRATRAFFDSV